MIVGVLGMAALMLVRVQRGQVKNVGDSIDAQLYARAAIDMAMFRIENNSNWRNQMSAGTWEVDQSIGNGHYSFQGIDPVDGDLTDDDSDPLDIIGTGKSGPAVHKLQVSLVEDKVPLEALKTCIHSKGELSIIAGKSLTVTGAPASTNANFQIEGTLYGSVDAASESGGGTVTGTKNIPAPPKNLPDADTFDWYKNKATVLPYSGDFDQHVLTPGVNTYGGGLNADGVYFISTGGADLIIKSTRIHGTLVVDVGSKIVILDNQVFLHSYRSDYPVLIVNGHVEMNFDSGTQNLDESVWGTNFNPSGAAYQGSSDSDQNDSYPNQIQGLVHVTRKLTMKSTSRIRGVIICEDKVDCTEFNEIIHDPNLVTNPPEGYYAPLMKIAPGSFKQVVY